MTTVYHVYRTIQSTLPGSTEDPVEIRQYRGTDETSAVLALAQAGRSTAPDERYYKVLGARVEHVEVPDPDVSEVPDHLCNEACDRDYIGEPDV